MLVLTRKAGETIRIGQDIVIKVIQTGKGTIKLGIEAPANVRVLRGELQAYPEGPGNRTREMSPTVVDAEIESFLAEFGDLFDLEFDLEAESAGHSAALMALS